MYKDSGRVIVKRQETAETSIAQFCVLWISPLPVCLPLSLSSLGIVGWLLQSNCQVVRCERGHTLCSQKTKYLPSDPCTKYGHWLDSTDKMTNNLPWGSGEVVYRLAVVGVLAILKCHMYGRWTASTQRWSPLMTFPSKWVVSTLDRIVNKIVITVFIY
jgi:hypothetical protein